MFRHGFDGATMDGRSFGASFGPHGFRARRGMIEPAILGVLLDQPMHGYEIMDKIEEQSHGMWRPSAGSVYPTLQLLEEKDLVIGKMQGDKKVYHLTDAGIEEANEAKELQDHLRSWSGKREEMQHLRHVRTEVHDIMRLMRRLRGQTSPEKIDKLLEMLQTFKHNLVELIEE